MNTDLQQPRLLLVSASARRQKILRDWNVRFEVLTPDTREVLYEQDAVRTAHENALLKCEWGRIRRPRQHILAADTVIDFAGRCVGKGGDLAEARAMLRRFSGKTHLVWTAVALARPASAPELILAQSTVQFRRLSEETIRQYVAEVQPLDRAGAYDIDEQGEQLIDSYTGSRANIMGLPIEVLLDWLRREQLIT